MREIARRLVDGIWRTGVVEEDSGSGDAFPDSWTVDTDGPLIVQNSEPFLIPLTTRGQSPIGDGIDQLFSAEDVNGVQVVYIAGDGLYVQDSDGQTVFGITTDGTLSIGSTTLMPASFAFSIGSLTYRMGEPGAQFNVQDHNGITVFQVRDDGTVHIKTGTTIQADL